MASNMISFSLIRVNAERSKGAGDSSVKMWLQLLTISLTFAQNYSTDNQTQPTFPGAGSNSGLLTTLVTASITTLIGLVLFIVLSRLPSMYKSFKFRERLKPEFGKAPKL